MSKTITVTYSLYIGSGEEEMLVEKAGEGRPFQFVSGMGYTYDAFEQNLENLKDGDSFDFVIPKEEANGDEIIPVEVDKSIFVVDGKFQDDEIFPGNIVPLMNADGEHLPGKVMEITEDKVVLNLNPLAGEDLHFVGTVLENREATADEIAAMANIMAGGGCGGCQHDCGSCGGGCEGSCEGGCEKKGSCGHCHG